MSRSFDFVVIGVIWIIAIAIHMMSVELFAPGSPLFDVAAGADTLDGERRAHLWHEMLAVWIPLLAVGGISAWGFIREYRRQAATGRGVIR